jgi:hypothetical protein
MKTRISRSTLAALLLLSTLNLQLSTLFAQGTAFTYQGRLNDGPAPANGLYDLTFSVFRVTNGGSPFAGPLTNSAVAVSNGLFTTLLDFGDGLFDDPGPVLLEIAVRPSGGGTFITLNPRQLVTPVPHSISSSLAFQAVSALGVANGVAVTRLNNLSDNVTLAAGANVTITPSGNSLTIAAPGGVGPWLLNGSSTFYNGGNVGIGTTTPGTSLHIATAGDPVMLLHDTGPALTQSGYIDFRNNSFTETAWVGFGTADPDFSIVNARSGGDIVLSPFSGNVGIGTATPAAKLEVRGNVKLGDTGQLFAPGGEENLRIIRGTVNSDGTINRGTGFTPSLPATGEYLIAFTTPFTGSPSMTVSWEYSLNAQPLFAATDQVSATTAKVVMQDNSRLLRNGPFHFIAIGPR